MSRKLEDTDFQFAVPCGVPKRRKVEVRNSDLNGKLSSLSRSSSFSFKTPSYNENLDAAFQSVATESSSKKSECSMPRMSSFLLKDSRKPNRDRRSHSLKKMSAFSGSWPKLGSSDFKNKSRNYSKNSKADKFTSNLLFDKDYHDFIASLVGDAGDKVDLDVTPPVGDLFDGEDDDDDDDDDVIKSSKDSVDLDVTPPVGDLFDDEDQDDEDDSGNKDSVDLDVTPPVGDLFDDDEDEDEDDDCKKEEIDLDKTPPVGDLFNDDDYADKSASSANSEDLQEITPPVSPSLSFGEDDFDTCKITTSDGVILKTGDDDEDSLRTSVGASRVFHVLPGDDQVTLTI